MRKLLTIGTLFALLVLTALPVLADHGEPAANGNCPEPKVEGAAVDQDYVPPAGTHLCLKGSDTIRFVTADGTGTIKVLLDSRNRKGKLQDVSHYSIIEETTTTTTQPEDTTTTTEVEDTTTTTEPETTTTTQPDTSTTVDPEDNDVPVIEEPAGGRVGASEPPEDESTGTPLPTLIPATPSTPDQPTELPFTGQADGLLPVGVALLLAGGAALGLSRRLRMDEEG